MDSKTVNQKYDDWVTEIAKSRDTKDLIAHFREHVYEHYDRHNRDGKLNMDIWLIGVLNFMHILEKKYPYLKKEDLLFKLCTYYKNHQDGPKPPFDIDEFLENYNSEIKQFHKLKIQKKSK